MQGNHFIPSAAKHDDSDAKVEVDSAPDEDDYNGWHDSFTTYDTVFVEDIAYIFNDAYQPGILLNAEAKDQCIPVLHRVILWASTWSDYQKFRFIINYKVI